MQSHFSFNDCVYCICAIKFIARKKDTDYTNAWLTFVVKFSLNSCYDLKDNNEFNLIIIMES